MTELGLKAIADVVSGAYPAPQHSVAIDDADFGPFVARIRAVKLLGMAPFESVIEFLI